MHVKINFLLPVLESQLSDISTTLLALEAFQSHLSVYAIKYIFYSSFSWLEHCHFKLIPLILHMKINLSSFLENNSSLATNTRNHCHQNFILIEELKSVEGTLNSPLQASRKPTSQRTVFFSKVKDFKNLDSQRAGKKRKNKTAVKTIVTTTISCSTTENMFSFISHCY